MLEVRETGARRESGYTRSAGLEVPYTVYDVRVRQIPFVWLVPDLVTILLKRRRMTVDNNDCFWHLCTEANYVQFDLVGVWF
jgi:hypothetical protein